MKRFATFTVLVLLTMLLLAGTVSANQTGAPAPGPTWANSNRSGETAVSWDGGPLLRNVPGQLTHTAFQLNTNSCASCHMTHTAVGANLLIQATTQDTCMACHDGTIGFLNVRAAATGSTSGAGMGGSVAAGTFGVVESINPADRTASMHNVFSDVTISGAPGGNRAGLAESGGAWISDFTCASCHAPHGSHSIRLLHSNPNNVALRPLGNVTSGVYTAGGRYTVSTATNFNLGAFTTAIHTNQITTTGTNPNVTGTIYTYTLTGTPAAPWMAGYANRVGGAVSNWTRIYHTIRNPNDATIRTDGTLANPATANWTAAELAVMLQRHFTINFATGTITQTPAQRTALITQLTTAPFSLSAADAAVAPLRIDVASGLQVRGRAAAAHQANLVLGARAVDFLDPNLYDAPAYNLFCAACHTDYLPTTSAGNQATAAALGQIDPDGVGIYSQKFRHTINRGASTAVSPMPVRGGTGFTGANLTGTASGSNQMMCLSCHFAHGADASMMLLADNTRVSANTGAAGTPTDPNQNDVSATLGGSSALKRYINQASCWHCHVRSSATVFQNTPHYWAQFPQGPTW